jgi:hypothetical protein
MDYQAEVSVQRACERAMPEATSWDLQRVDIFHLELLVIGY